VDDTARGHIQAMERGTAGESYIIAGPVHTLVEVLQIAHRITGIPGPRLRLPPPMMQATATLIEPVEHLLPLPQTYSAEALRSSAGATYLGTNAKAKRELGFTVRPIEEGLRETLTYEMRQLGLAPPAV
jgi:nucleoside-diphosphate-sugar epimerase